MVKLLDCTLRDGGYYNNWDFDNKTAEVYCKNIAKLPIDYIEIGYRNKPKTQYYGQYYYLPLSTIKKIKGLVGEKQKLVVMVDYKDIQSFESLEEMLSDIVGIVDLIRITSPLNKVTEVIKFAKFVKEMGFETAINLMYLSKWTEEDISDIITNVKDHQSSLDFLYIVDSFGGSTPDQIKNTLITLKKNLEVPLGFHGHNNIELALANSIACLEEDINIIDSTILGMGRGAGNLKTELFLLYLKKINLCSFEYSNLSPIVSIFQSLLDKYKWGTNFPYIISGMNSMPQKTIMDLLSKDRYSIEDIIKKMNISDDVNSQNKYSSLLKKDYKDLENKQFLIIGGGESIKVHYQAIFEFLSQNQDITIIYSTTRYVSLFNKLKNRKILCLLESDYLTLSDLDHNSIDHIDLFIASNYSSSVNDSEVLQQMIDKIYVNDNSIFKKIDQSDSPLLLSLKTAINLSFSKIFIAGFDGYDSKNHVYKDLILHKETQEIIVNFSEEYNDKLESLTQSTYNYLNQNSIYSKI